MKIYNPFRFLSKFEWGLWIGSLCVITVASLIGGEGGGVSLAASLFGVTALIFVAKGDVVGQVLIVLFSLLYAVVSWEQAYYGEMITYLFMSTPAAIFSIVSWLRHPFAKDRNEVEIARLSVRHRIEMIVLTVLITLTFYPILTWFGTAVIWVSTLSVATSFLASYLLFRRSPYYALAYAANDVVLIVLWCIATAKDLSYLSMVACFVMFLCNDLYGFINWLRMQARQRTEQGESTDCDDS